MTKHPVIPFSLRSILKFLLHVQLEENLTFLAVHRKFLHSLCYKYLSLLLCVRCITYTFSVRITLFISGQLSEPFGALDFPVKKISEKFKNYRRLYGKYWFDFKELSSRDTIALNHPSMILHCLYSFHSNINGWLCVISCFIYRMFQLILLLRLTCGNGTHSDISYTFKDTWSFSTREMPPLTCYATLFLSEENLFVPDSVRR